MKYDLVIFDFDGTLADTFPWVMSIIDQIADQFKVKRLEQRDVSEMRKLDTRQMLQYYGISLWKLAAMAREVQKMMDANRQRIVLFEGVDALLKDLSRMGARLALVSSNNLENVQRILGEENAALFTYYECGVSVFGKPAKFKKVLHKSGVARERTLCVGDEIRDVQAARGLNIPFGAVSWGLNTLEALQMYAPDEVFSTVGEIAACLSD